MIKNQAVLLLTAGVLPLIYLQFFTQPLNTKLKNVAFGGLFAGILSALFLILLKTLFLPSKSFFAIKETLTLALFISLIEAGLLEEIVKNGFYLLGFTLLKNKFNFENNKYLYFALSASVGLGFGILENCYYAFNPETAKFNILFDRVWTTIPAHIFMNSTFGFLHAKKCNLVIALLVSVFIHGLYDFFALPSTLLGSLLVKLTLIIGFGFVLFFASSLLKTKNMAEVPTNELG